MKLARADHDPMTIAALELARGSEPEPVFNHSVRSYLWALLLADHENLMTDADYDPVLLFAATVMHDLGTGSRAAGRQRFEVEGADLAAELLTAHGFGAKDVDRVWEAIAIHTSAGIAERRGLLAYLTREGVGIDFGRRTELVREHQAAVHARYPRREMVRSLSMPSSLTPRMTRWPRRGTRCPVNSSVNEPSSAQMDKAAATSAWG